MRTDPSSSPSNGGNYASLDFRRNGADTAAADDTVGLSVSEGGRRRGPGCCPCAGGQVTWASIKQEIPLLLKIGWPVILTNFLNFVILSESVMMCGHLTKDELDGAALANSLINALGLSIGIGLCTGCDTLFSQSYGSANKKRVGTYLLQSIMIISMFPFLILALHINILPILLALGQLPHVSSLAADYMLWFSPGLIFNFVYLILARYLQNQDRVYAPMICAGIGNVFNLVSQYLRIYVWNMGFLSSAVCQAVTFVLMFILLLGYIIISRAYEETWNGWDVESLFNWWQFLRLALPGMAMIALETFCWEVGTFIAGYMGEEELGAQSILFQTETWTFMIALGLSIAVNIRVGQSLGAMNGDRAKVVWLSGICCLLCSATVTTLIFITCRNLLPYIFTNDASIADIASGILPILGLFQYIDGISCISAGALRGCGRQAIGALLIICAYYVLGLPIGIPVALKTPLGVLGQWLGLLIGITIACPAFVILLCRQDWQQQADLAQDRIRLTRERQRMYGSDDKLSATASDAGVPSDQIRRMVIIRLVTASACVSVLLLGVGCRLATWASYETLRADGGLNATVMVDRH